MVSGIAPPPRITMVDYRHPDYTECFEDWVLWRDTYYGGRHYVDTYLKQYSNREDPSEFAKRKEITPCPAFAAAIIDDIKNNIYNRMIDITRVGGSKLFLEACTGANHGVDLAGSSMNHFIGQHVLPELLCMRKVGVYVDMPELRQETTLFEAIDKRPYIYLYHAEDIVNWVHVNPYEFSKILVKEQYIAINELYGFPSGYATRYRHMFLVDGRVAVQYYNTDGVPIDLYGNESYNPVILELSRIPFVIFELPKSLLKDIATYQIALLNMLSADIAYILKANFPFYTEQRDFRANSQNIKGEADDILVGSAGGRSYAQGLERPGFINPSPDPLRVSMEKQDQMKMEMRQLVNLAISNLVPLKQQSAEAKGMDNQGLEAGLAFIGLELERGERKISEFWGDYVSEKPTTIHYPTEYSVKTDAERIAESKSDETFLTTVPSLTYQKAMAKKIAKNLLGYKVSKEELAKIMSEVDNAQFIVPPRSDFQKDVELGIIDRQNASKALFYPDDAVEKANLEHADRLAEIVKSQSGAKDVQTNNGATNKTNTDTNISNEIPVRGKGNGRE